ncbi:MAG: aldose epimerase family protein [Gemmatimonadota bacterium]
MPLPTSERASTFTRGAAVLCLALAFASCADGGGADLATGDTDNVATVYTAAFGALPTGETVTAYTLTNRGGTQVRILDYGAIIQSIRVPDRDGGIADVALGYDSIGGYLQDTFFFGVVAGRYANRIAGGRFDIDGTAYQLARNSGPNHLHGGDRGFDNVLWQAQPFQHADSVGVVLRYTSVAGEEGYPGTLDASVTYTLTPGDRLIVDYAATTDAPTHVNLTQHTYFNLAGADAGDVLGHRISLNASRFTPVDSTAIPTGELAPVDHSPFDLRAPVAIGDSIDDDHDQIRLGGGFNHNFVLDRDGTGLVRAARVVEPRSGRTLEVFTTEPGIQFYTGNRLDGSAVGKGGRPYASRSGFCLETQHFPDSPNRPEFPSTLLRPGETYRSTTVFAFGHNG